MSLLYVHVRHIEKNISKIWIIRWLLLFMGGGGPRIWGSTPCDGRWGAHMTFYQYELFLMNSDESLVYL